MDYLMISPFRAARHVLVARIFITFAAEFTSKVLGETNHKTP